MKTYVVLDLEWNQSPSGKSNSIEHFPFEIIEIGAIKLNETFDMISEFHALVKPKVYQQIHYKISEVTHMNMQELQGRGSDFSVVINDFLAWCGTGCIFCTWGTMDLTELQRNMSYYEIEIPFENPFYYYDVQKLYSLLRGDSKVKQSLDVVVEELGILQNRPFHRALDDAYYTGQVLKAIDFHKISAFFSLDYYRLPQNREEEIYATFPGYSKYVSRIFPSKEEAIADKAVTDMLCCECGKVMRKKLRWFSPNQRFYFGLGTCPEHGFFKGKIRMKKTEDGNIYVVKTLKPIGEEEVNRLYTQQEDNKERRRKKNRLKRKEKRV